MALPLNQLLVVDACVLRSAGDTPHPHSVHCAQLLDAILDSGQGVATCAELTAEWDRHACDYAQQWRLAMQAHGQLVPIDIAPGRQRLTVQINALPGLSPTHRAALSKDAHLLVAALETGRMLLTGDTRLKKLAAKRLAPGVQWLIVHQQDSNTVRAQLLARVQGLSVLNQARSKEAHAMPEQESVC